MQDEPERIAAAWARVVRVIGLVALPSLGGLVVMAPDFVPVVLGSQWKDAVPVVQILAWVGIVQAVQALNYDVLMARDRTRTMFRFSVVLTACHLVAFGVGLEWGVVGVAVGYAISTTLVEPFQTLLAARCLGVSPMVFVRALSGVFQATLAMCALVLVLRLGLVDTGVSQTVRLLVCSAAGALAFVPLALWRVPELAGEARSLLRRGQMAVPPIPGAAATAEP
jgi:O-antigen/teichoic acid export membrane protein